MNAIYLTLLITGSLTILIVDIGIYTKEKEIACLDIIDWPELARREKPRSLQEARDLVNRSLAECVGG